MRRKPVILIFLLLLLSLGGAVVHHHLRENSRPSFGEVDATLRSIDSEGWRFKEHADLEPYTERIYGWWDKLHIRRKQSIKQDGYLFIQEGTQETFIVSVFRYDGRFAALICSDFSAATDSIRNIVSERLPGIADLNTERYR